MTGQRVTYGQVAINGRGDQDVWRGIHGRHLEKLDRAAQEVVTLEPEGHVPNELRKDIKEGDEEIGEAEVDDQQVHATQLLPPQTQNQQHGGVTEDGEE